MVRHTTIRCEEEILSHTSVSRVARELATRSFSDIAYLTLNNVNTSTTAGLARLIAVRRGLLREGRDMEIVGLHGRGRALYELYRLKDLLPESHR